MYGRRLRGFTLMELLVVLALIALLLGIAAPVVTGSIQRARESTLKEDLFVMRKAIDGYFADHGVYPAELGKLVDRRYLRQIPIDPLTARNSSWVVVEDESGTGIVDIHSGADGSDADGKPYREL